MKFKDIFLKLSDAVFPDGKQCIICRNEFIDRNGYGVCDECFKKLPFNNGKKCLKCDKPVSTESDYCQSCLNSKRYFEKAYAPMVYEGEIIKLMTLFKFKNRAYLSKYISRFMAYGYEVSGFDCDLIAFVPISKKTFRKREYNQAELLAKQISKSTGIPLIDNLEKINEKRIQHELTGKERENNIEGTFKIKQRKLFKGKRVLLIDDILTTGATVNEISRLILLCQAESVFVLVFANTPFRTV